MIAEGFKNEFQSLIEMDVTKSPSKQERSEKTEGQRRSCKREKERGERERERYVYT